MTGDKRTQLEANLKTMVDTLTQQSSISTTLTGKYKISDIIRSQYFINNTKYFMFNGKFSLPVRDFNGRCNYNNYAYYYIDQIGD